MILIKIGGDRSLNLAAICKDVADLWQENKGKVIVVHGASKYRNELAKHLNIPVKKIVSASGVESYYSDEKFMEVFLMSYAGLLNKKIVAELIKNKVRAVGLSGIDGLLWKAERKKFLYVKEGSKIKLKPADLSGKVREINSSLLQLLLQNDYLPVICSPAVSEKGEILNVDNDAAIEQMIEPLGVKVLISLFSAPGILRDSGDESSVIKRVNHKDLTSLLSSAEGTMKKKIISLQKSFENGLEKAYLGDGRVENPIKSLLKGKGTVVS